jgi:hypothetical protein
LWHFLSIRFVDCKGAPRQGEWGGQKHNAVGGLEARKLVETMGKCFDLRKLCEEPCPLIERKEALSFIHAAAARSMGMELPALQLLQEQLEVLRARLVTGARGRFKAAWFDSDGRAHSGTVIMAYLYTEKELYEDCGDIMWLFEACVLKIRNEAVVEGMGSIVSKHADKRRGRIEAESYTGEAFVHFNGPPLGKADKMIRTALDKHFFTAKKKGWHFRHTSRAGQAGVNSMVSEVLQRLLKEKSKLPCWG